MPNKNYLGDPAIQQINRALRDVADIKRRIGKLERNRAPMPGKQVYAEIIDSTGAEYDATQVFHNGSWTPVVDGLEWDESSDLGVLKEFNDAEDMSGVFPLWLTGADNDEFQWFFAADTTGPEVVYARITGSDGSEYDATEVSYNGSWSTVVDGRGWGNDGTELPLLEFNYLEDMSGVFPLWHTTDTVSQWWFLGDPRGLTEEIEQDLIFDIEYAEDEVDFRKTTITSSLSNGMVQEYTVGAEESAGMITSKEWIKIQGGQIQHVNFNAPWATITHDGTNWSSGGATGPDYTEFNDTRGHLVKFIIDSTEFVPPEDQTNYKYVNCEDEADFIVIDTSSDQVFSKDGECFQFLSETTDAIDIATPTFDYTDCSDCLGDQTNTIYQNCDTTTEYILTPAQVQDPALWVCFDGTLAKAYDTLVKTPDAGNVTSVLLQCDGNVTDCDDLTGWPLSDGWSSGCDSVVVGDSNWGIRWDTVNWPGQQNIASSSLVQTSAAGAQNPWCTITTGTNSGDFTVSVPLSVQNEGTAADPNGRFSFLLVITTTGAYRAWHNNDSSGNRWIAQTPSGSTGYATGGATSGDMTIARSGGTITVTAGVGGNTRSQADTGAVTLVRLLTDDNRVAKSFIGTWGAFSVSGLPNADPTGRSC